MWDRTRILATALALLAAFAAPGCERDCNPPCRSGFICVKGECMSSCNPPCPADKLCRAGECFVDDTMPTPDVVVHVPLTTDSGAKAPPPAPPPPVSVGVPEFGCMGEESDGYHKCGSKPGEAMIAKWAEKTMEALVACETELVTRKPGAAGKLALRGDFDLASGGGAEGLSVSEDGIGDDAFKKCVLKSAYKIYAPDCCDYYLRITVPIFVNQFPPVEPGATGAPGAPGAATAAPGATAAPTGAPASGTATPPGMLPRSVAPGPAAVPPAR